MHCIHVLMMLLSYVAAIPASCNYGMWECEPELEMARAVQLRCEIKRRMRGDDVVESSTYVCV